MKAPPRTWNAGCPVRDLDTLLALKHCGDEPEHHTHTTPNRYKKGCRQVEAPGHDLR